MLAYTQYTGLTRSSCGSRAALMSFYPSIAVWSVRLAFDGFLVGLATFSFSKVSVRAGRSRPAQVAAVTQLSSVVMTMARQLCTGQGQHCCHIHQQKLGGGISLQRSKLEK